MKSCIEVTVRAYPGENYPDHQKKAFTPAQERGRHQRAWIRKQLRWNHVHRSCPKPGRRAGVLRPVLAPQFDPARAFEIVRLYVSKRDPFAANVDLIVLRRA